MFTIKATYCGQIRKHTFLETNSFPTYDEICDQLHRLFAIPHAFYLSKLLFSPDAAQRSRILIGKEARSAYDYNKYIRQFKDRTWPHGLLRFIVCDQLSSSGLNSSSHRLATPLVLGHRNSMSQMPPVFSSGMPMDVDCGMSIFSNHATPVHTQFGRPTQQFRASASTIESCCSVSEGKAEIKAIITEFQEVLDRVVTSNLSPPAQPCAPSDASMEAPPPSLCSVCTGNMSQRSLYLSCESCHVVVCYECHIKDRAGFCLNLMGPHKMALETSTPGQTSSMHVPRLPIWTPRSASAHTHGLGSQNVPSSTSAPETRETGNPVQGPALTTASAQPVSTAPVVHRGIVCDSCDGTVIGVRHKCLDCPDYDLCTACMAAGRAEAHNPFHEFFDITEPGRVIVHTVFSGNGERETSSASRTTEVPQAPAAQPIVHNANCDLCDSRIQGDRYKCLNCPDFDTCSSCFSITREQHPQHAFVRIEKVENYLPLQTTPRSMHYASCNGCSKAIFGSRFKCMHPDCPDYDLCENCEALPIAVHPRNHPMLKMKAPETVIPTVYRVGQTNLIHHANSSNSETAAKAPIPIDNNMTFAPPKAPSPAPRQRKRSPSVSEQEDRVKTPTPIHPAPVMPARPVSPVKPPPVPPKPEMISHASWASIPGFFEPSMSLNWEPEPVNTYERFSALPDIFTGSKASLKNPFADIPFPDTPISPVEPIGPARPDITFAPEISLPSVPSHTPNPWPTTNPMERQELFKLIAKISGPLASPSVLNNIADVPPTPDMASIEERKPLVYLSESKSRHLTTPPPPPVDPCLHAPQPVSTSPIDHIATLDNVASLQKEAQATAVMRDDSETVAFGDFSMSHLLEGLKQRVDALKAVVEATNSAQSATESLSDEPLLKRPLEEPMTLSRPISPRRSLSHLISELPSLIPSEAQHKDKEPEIGPLNAVHIEDVTPDGQVFPPGAEFMKCWRLLNGGNRDWPESTELVFLAGAPLMPEKTSPAPVKIGKVIAGAEIDIWTGELKAPDAPGQYVGYWRLRADGECFGTNLWIEINVVEADSHHSSDESMAASSIIMPTVSSAPQSQHVASTTVRSASMISDDNMSDAGSDISLISMPSSPSDSADEALWHDSRSQTTAELAAVAAAAANALGAATPAESAADYVLLYDDTSSEEE